jgi:hypothetical protein
MKIKNFSMFKESNEIKTFENTLPEDVVLMENDEIIDLISNTFESKVISTDPNYTIIESSWHNLDASYVDEELKGVNMKVYFHIIKPTSKYDQFVIFRGEKDKLEEILEKAKAKYPNVTGEIGNGSLSLKGKHFPRVLHSLQPIPKGEEGVDVNDYFYSLNGLGCSVDIRTGRGNMAYFSNLLVGSDVQQEVELRSKYPGMNKMSALQKSVEDTIAKNPDLFKHLKRK